MVPAETVALALNRTLIQVGIALMQDRPKGAQGSARTGLIFFARSWNVWQHRQGSLMWFYSSRPAFDWFVRVQHWKTALT